METVVLWVAAVLVCCTALPLGTRDNNEGVVQESSFQDYFNRFNITEPQYYGPVAGLGVLLLITIVLVFLCIGWCCRCYKRKTHCFKRRYEYERRPLIDAYPDALYTNGHPARVEVRGKRRPERTVADELRRQKEQQEHNDRVNANKIVRFFLRSEKVYEFVEELPDMGSRMLKYWYKIRDNHNRDMLLTIAPVSQKCPLVLEERTVATMNDLCSQLQHPNLHPAHKIHYISRDHMVIIIQPFRPPGSLKDKIYKSAPTSEWTVKYSRRCKGLPRQQVALYGKQILEGLRYLYARGFPPLGHVQTGNVFMGEGRESNVCRLGGFENTLLGYKTRAYKLCKEHLEHIDLILFGHVLFEIACGYELTEIHPREAQYKDVKDERVREILQLIFRTDGEGHFTSTIEQVYNDPFFQEVEVPDQPGAVREESQLTREMRDMLGKVAKNKPRVQKPPKKDKGKKKRSKEGGAEGGADETPRRNPPS